MTRVDRGLFGPRRRTRLSSRSFLLAGLALATVLALLGVAPALSQSASTSSASAGQQPGASVVSVSPSSDGVGAGVSLSGSGFAAGKDLTATFDSQPLTLVGTCATSSTGALSGCSFRVPPSSPGTHTVAVSDGTNTAKTSFTIPSISIPESTFLVTTTSVGLSFLTQLVTRRVVNLNAERKMKAELAAFNKEKREATLAKDKAKLEKLKKRELSMRQAQAKVSTARLKVTAVTFVPLLGVYYLMANFLGGFNVVVAHSPVPIPFLVNADGTMVLFWWYLLSSFAFSSLLTKLMHTTT